MRYTNKTLKYMGVTKAAARRGRYAYRSDSLIVMDEDGSLNAKATATRIMNDANYKKAKATYNKWVNALADLSMSMTEISAIFDVMGFQNENSSPTEDIESWFYNLMDKVRKSGGKWGDPNLMPIAELYSLFNRMRSDLHGPIQWNRWAKENIRTMKNTFKPIP